MKKVDINKPPTKKEELFEILEWFDKNLRWKRIDIIVLIISVITVIGCILSK